MSDNASSPSSLKNALVVALGIVPLKEEEDDLDTLALAGQIHSDVRQKWHVLMVTV
jgi:hypothetical protein